jgi:hypothetical protein
MSWVELLKGNQLRAYRELEAVLKEVWDSSETTGAIPPLDQRISLSVTKVARYGFVPCVHVDREDSSAYRRAKEILGDYPFVLARLGGGEAQSAYPQDSKTTAHALSGQLLPGAAISHGRYPFGTLGCVVEAEVNRVKSLFAVTAAHVVNLNDEASLGDPIYCPGKGSVARIKKGDRFGTLEDSVDLYPLNPKSRGSKVGDVSTDIDIALVRITDESTRRLPTETRVPNPKYPDEKTIKITGVAEEAKLGELLTSPVFLYGAVSGFSAGKLTDIGITKKVLRLPDRLNYMYHDLMGVAPKDGSTFSRPGDSGGIIYTEEGLLVGFLIGADNNVSFACVGDRALKEFNARIV